MFDISQYEHSSSATSLGIDNRVPEDKLDHIYELDALLDKASIEWAAWCKKNNLGNPAIILTSGYRSPELNEHVGGSQSSAHVEGYAADVIPANMKTSEFIQCILEWASSGKELFDEIIVEGLPGSQWMHIGVRSSSGEQRMKTMKETSGRLVPTKTPTDIVYGTEQTEVQAVTKAESSPFVLDWTDDAVFNMTPQELDAVTEEDEYGPMMLLSSWNNRVYNSHKRCLCIMNALIEKLALTPAQAAGILGNMLYMTDGTLATYKKSRSMYGICNWNAKDKILFDKMHYRTCTMEESTVREQVEFLCFMIEDSLVSKLRTCYDENSACNLFFSKYLKKCAWSDMFYGLSKREETQLREEAAQRRAYASAALELWNDSEYVNTSEMMEYSGNGQDGPRMKPADDSKIYVSDGEMYEVPESEQEFVYDDDTGGFSYEDNDPEAEDYYAQMFYDMMLK